MNGWKNERMKKRRKDEKAEYRAKQCAMDAMTMISGRDAQGYAMLEKPLLSWCESGSRQNNSVEFYWCGMDGGDHCESPNLYLDSVLGAARQLT